MDSREDACDYDTMDHGEVNAAFVSDLLAALAECPLWSDRTRLEHRFEVLDAGTGTALIPLELAGRCADVQITAVDMSPAMLALAKRHVEEAGFSDRIDLRIDDGKDLALAGDRFDVVISNSLVHHLPQPEVALGELLRVLRPGGLLFVRDLARPADEVTVEELVGRYTGGESPRQQQLFRDSLHAGLTVSEVREMLDSLSLPVGAARMTSDRHWTVCEWAPKPDGRRRGVE